jgi:hypothetical protein
MFTTREVALVIQRARRDLWKAHLLQLAELAGIGVCAIYGVYPYLLDAALAMGPGAAGCSWACRS